MSTAICTVCAKGYLFRGHRGTKLADCVCTCGRPLTIARWTERGFVPKSLDKERDIRDALEYQGALYGTA